MASVLKVDQLQTLNGTNVMTFDSAGNAVLSSGLKLPSFTNSTRPTGQIGLIIYNSEEEQAQIFDGTEWTGLGGGGKLDGLSVEKAALSAYQIKTDFPFFPTGLYWIKNELMTTATQVYCDMSFDSGGWMMLAYGFVPEIALPNLNHNGTVYSYTPTARSSSRGLVDPKSSQQTALKLSQKSTQIIFAAGSNPSTGGIDSYTYAYKFDIPSPSTLTFANHSMDNTTASTPVATVSVTGLKGESGSWTAYTFRDSLGATWSDSYPTGYGVANTSNVRGWNGNGGPFFPSVHSGSSPRNNGTGWNAGPDVTNGHSTYDYRGWYGRDGGIGVNQSGQTSIWVK